MIRSQVKRWFVNSYNRIREHGILGVNDSIYAFYVNLAQAAGMIFEYGTPIYEKEWDVLIVLDALRVDVIEDVATGYEFLDQPGTINSVGSTSWEWLEKTFSDKYAERVSETIYITANPNSDNHVDSDAFRELDEVWRYAWDEEIETVPPRAVTDRAIHHRRHDPEASIVVHYMQPHRPFLNTNTEVGFDYDGENYETTPGSHWGRLRSGEISREEVLTAFQQNTKAVLDDVSLLLQNLDAERVVITADHGECLGEWNVYGHHSYVPLPSLKKVPWYITESEDQHTHNPDRWGSENEVDVEERLQALGYK